jgi:hypothetical protein
MNGDHNDCLKNQKEQRNSMKTRIESSITRRTLLALGVAALFALPVAGIAQEKGAEKLVKLNRIQTTDNLQAVKPGDTIVMSCPKCKDIWVTVGEPAFKGAGAKQERVVKQHQCPGCGSERVTTGHGKAKTTEIVHVCKACGSQEATCCVMKKGASQTSGMKQN